MMMRTGSICGFVVALLLLGPGTALADQHGTASKSKSTPEVSARAPALPQYKSPIPPKAPGFVPPMRGSPAGRVGGGSRGIGDKNIPVLAVLVPDHVARTSSEQPALFWYIDAIPEPGTSLIFALLDEDSVEPISEITLTVTKPGVQRISLAEQGVKLEPGVEYEWSVALVLDPKQRSSDIIASGWAIRVDAPTKLGSEPSTDLVTAYAEAGLWYDALATISELIDKNPDDKSLRQIRAELLRQVGFQDLANAES